MEVLGIDIGGSGIKGAIVNSTTGELVSERHRVKTPNPATPKPVAQVVKSLVEHFEWSGPVGCSFPAVVVSGKCYTAGNISEQWVGVQVDKLFTKECVTIQLFGNMRNIVDFRIPKAYDFWKRRQIYHLPELISML